MIKSTESAGVGILALPFKKGRLLWANYLIYYYLSLPFCKKLPLVGTVVARMYVRTSEHRECDWSGAQGPRQLCSHTQPAWVPVPHLTRDSRCPRQDAGRKSRQVGFWRQETPLLASSDFRTPCRPCLAPPHPQTPAVLDTPTSPSFPLSHWG